MIKNKSQFINALKNNKIKAIKRIYNLNENTSKIKINDIATIEEVKTTFYKLKYKSNNKIISSYYNNFEVKDNKIYYYELIPEYKEEEARKLIKEKYNNSIELIPLTEKEKENNNKYCNYNYTYKVINFINEIIEE